MRCCRTIGFAAPQNDYLSGNVTKQAHETPMTYYTQTDARPSAIFKVVEAVSGFFSSLIDAQARARDVQRLHNMSDHQLRDMNVRREDIVRHVFRDVYYL